MKSIHFNIESFIGFLLLGGTPIIMLLVFYYYGYDNSYLFVVLTKMILFIAILLYYLRGNRRLTKSVTLLLFFVFWSLWYLRVFHDAYYQEAEKLMLAPSSYYLFSIFFAITPFLYGNLSKDDESTQSILNGILTGNLFLSVIVVSLYYEYLFIIHRLGVADSSINSLSLAYISTMNIGYFIWKNITDRFSIFNISVILINIPVLGFGSSRGSILALMIGLLIVLMVVNKIRLKLFITLTSGFILYIYVVSDFFTVLGARFWYYRNLNATSEKEARYYLWKYSIEKFLENPIFGYHTEIPPENASLGFGSAYPHNIIFESLLSLGMVGGLLMISIISISIRNAVKIAKRDSADSWILLFYLITLTQNMLSGNIYSGAIWFWFFTGLINGRYVYLKRQV